ncbi:MAG: response regulator [Proteobacteria bacterium]|nr:response regulator [Pseudomonadota bacterium]
MPRLVYVVDDEKPMRELVAMQLSLQGIESRTFSNGYDVISTLQQEVTRPDVLLVDLMMPGMDGLTLLRTMRELAENVPVVILTGHGSIKSAVEAMKLGAADFMTKPVDGPRLEITLRNALERTALRNEVGRLSRQVEHQTDFTDLIGTSEKMQRLFSQLRRAAGSDITVCLQGASGTGKELMARAIHDNSSRREAPFIVVDCGAIPPNLIESTLFGHERGAFTGATEKRVGKFKEADGGTVFLDEIGELELPAQTRLLRVLQEREVEPIGSNRATKVNVRLVTATHRNLSEMVKLGTFREDLYYRIHVLPIFVPALEDRRSDIPALAQHFTARLCAQENIPQKVLTKAAVEWLVSQPWPGNVRQLENHIHRAVIMTDSDRIDVTDLNPDAPEQGGNIFDVFNTYPPDSLPTLDLLQEAYTAHVVSRMSGNLTRAAQVLGIGRTTLYRHLGADAQKSDAGA